MIEFVKLTYFSCLGNCYVFWNCSAASRLPVLVGLMAGEAALEAEQTSDQKIVEDALHVLQRINNNNTLPILRESLVTKWAGDPFSRGTYSYVGRHASGEDYDILAKPLGDTVFFGGEATCRTHPATVHGAFISGLRTASQVLDSIMGPLLY